MTKGKYPEFQDIDEAERTLLAYALRTIDGGSIRETDLYDIVSRREPWLAPTTLRAAFANLVADGRLVTIGDGGYRRVER